MRHTLRTLLSIAIFLGTAATARTQALLSHDPHSTEEWARIAPHLPDPLTASAEKLEVTGDVLRARRFPNDALTYYKAAVTTGGSSARLLKKQGVTHLELQHGLIARLCFQQAVQINKKDGEAWNNLGAADFTLGEAYKAVGEYKRAVKLNRDSAIYRSNLSLAYFEIHDARNARKELRRALAIDPEVLHHNNFGGYNLQVLSASHYAEICFEMARFAASQGDRETTLSWLTKASDRGFDVRSALRGDPKLQPLLEDERVKALLDHYDLEHANEMARLKQPALASTGVH